MTIRRLVWMGLLAWPLGGCYSLGGMMAETRTERTQLLSSATRSSPSPIRDALELSAVWAEGGASLRAERVSWCRDTVAEVHAVTTVTERSLPSSHWYVLAGAVVLAGGGATLLGVGVDQLAEGERLEVGMPAQEESYDEGRIMVSVGGVGLGVGAAMLTSEVIDLIAQMDDISDPVEVERETAAGTSECIREAADGLMVSVETETGTAFVHLGSDGHRVLSLSEPPLVGLREGATRLILSCEGCTPVTLPLPEP